MPNYKVSDWTIIEAENEEEAKELFIQDIDEKSIDVKQVI